ncbi:MAG TPA: hypothetical protein VIM81_17770 [Gammaproteobacteria bacterium]
MKWVYPLGAMTSSFVALAGAGPACAAGEPDFSGVWQAYASVPQFGPGQAAALTEEGARLVDAYFAQYGDDFVEPGAYCVPPGMPSTMTAMVSYPVEIIHSPNRVTMLAELDMQVRRIYMDGRGFPESYPTSRMGYSIGHWEDETLVIETRLLSEYLMRSWPRTENTQIVERVHRANRDELDVERNGFPEESESNDILVFEMTVTDATLYKEPQRITMYYQRIPEDEFLEYDCAAGLWDQALHGEGY